MELERQRDLLTVLYPLFKEEVYRRRENMMRLAAGGAVTVLALLGFLLLRPGDAHLTPFESLLLGTATFLVAGLFSFLILQQRDRHRMAKQTLIDIERSLGFYEAGFFPDHRTLYPEHWQTAWLSDRSYWVYILSLVMLAILVSLALLSRSAFF